MLRMTLLAGLLLTASGCSQTGQSGNFCDLARPIYFHQGDDLTDATVDSVVNHDLLGAKLCGWRPPGK